MNQILVVFLHNQAEKSPEWAAIFAKGYVLERWQDNIKDAGYTMSQTAMFFKEDPDRTIGETTYQPIPFMIKFTPEMLKEAYPPANPVTSQNVPSQTQTTPVLNKDFKLAWWHYALIALILLAAAAGLGIIK